MLGSSLLVVIEGVGFGFFCEIDSGDSDCGDCDRGDLHSGGMMAMFL